MYYSKNSKVFVGTKENVKKPWESSPRVKKTLVFFCRFSLPTMIDGVIWVGRLVRRGNTDLSLVESEVVCVPLVSILVDIQHFLRFGGGS